MNLKDKIDNLVEVWLQANDEEKNRFCATITVMGMTKLNMLIAVNELAKSVTAREGGAK